MVTGARHDFSVTTPQGHELRVLQIGWGFWRWYRWIFARERGWIDVTYEGGAKGRVRVCR